MGDGAEGSRGQEDITARALEFQILTCVRPANVRLAVWSEIDGNVWEIPGEEVEEGGQRMKTGEPHRVPLCKRAIEILDSLPRIAGNEHIFPGAGRAGVLGPDALNRMAKSSGYVDPKQQDRPISAHGFRSTFSTWGGERSNFAYEVREFCLAHDVKSEVARAYNRGDLFDKRRKVMDAWARYCESPIADTANVTELHGAA